MQVKILGSAAGGAFPQWNCACANCRAVRAGTFHGKPRTQTQVAITEDGRSWFLLGASPDLRAQIEATPELHPRDGCASRPSPAWCSPTPISTTSSDCFCCANFNRCAFTPPLRFAAFSAKTTPCSACCIEFQIKRRGPILNPEKNFLCATLKAKTPVSAAGPWSLSDSLSRLRHRGPASATFPGEASLGFFIHSNFRLALGLYARSSSTGRRPAAATRRLRRPALRWHVLER